MANTPEMSNKTMDERITCPEELLPCPFCGAEAQCSHEHRSKDEWSTPVPVCAIYCPTNGCPANGNWLQFSSNIAAIKEASEWNDAYEKARQIWNKRAHSASGES